MQALKALLDETKGTSRSATTTTRSSEKIQTADSAKEIAALLQELMEMMGQHMGDLTDIMRSTYSHDLMVK